LNGDAARSRAAQLGGLAIGDVADDPNKDRLIAVAGLADGKIHREHRPVLAPPHDLAADPYDPFLAGAQIVCEIGVMLARIGLGHQHFDIASDQLLRGIAEKPLRRMVNRADRAVPIDDHDPVDRGVDNRAIEGVGEAVAVLAVGARLCQTQLPDPRISSNRSRP